MKVLVVGGGAREHAIAWKLAASPRVQLVFLAPGNGGTAQDGRMVNLPQYQVASAQDIASLAQWVIKEDVRLTVVGPETPLAAGIVDHFRQRKLAIVGPTQACAKLEYSKAWSKAFMQRHGIPTAAYATFLQSQSEAAHAYIETKFAGDVQHEQQNMPIVIKADALAAGKGVIIAITKKEAHNAVDELFSLQENTNNTENSDSEPSLVIEEFIAGIEASFMVVTDGKTILPLATSQDHKRLLAGNLGPNTGGMGAYSPAPIITPNIHAKVLHSVIKPTLLGMEKEGVIYTGFLYAGLMIQPDGGIKTLEFNCRLGDPEAQVVLMRLKSNFLDLMLAAANGQLQKLPALEWDRRVALGVVMTSAGYPGPQTSPNFAEISPKSLAPQNLGELQVFHGGTQLRNNQLLATGGRVLTVCALEQTIKAAQRKANEGAEKLRFTGAQWRTDIGHQALIG